MTDSIGLSDLTNAYERKHQVIIDSNVRAELNSYITSQLKNVIYVSNQIAKRSRRRTLKCSDLVLGFETCGFLGALPFPTESKLDSYSWKNYPNQLSISDNNSNVVSIMGAISPPLMETPIKEYTFSIEWIESCIHPNLQTEENPLAKTNLIEYYSSMYRDGSEAENQVFCLFLEESPKVTAILQDVLSFIRDEVIRILKEKPILMTFYLFRLMRAILSITHNYSVNITLYSHYFLPTVFSVLCSKRISYHQAEGHWRVRNLAANSISNTYSRSVDICGTSHAMIQETLFAQFQRSDASMECIYGCLHCIRLIGDTLLQSFVDTIFFPLFRDDDHYEECCSEPMIREDLSSILNSYLSCNILSEKRFVLQQEVQKLAPHPEVVFPKSTHGFGVWPC